MKMFALAAVLALGAATVTPVASGYLVAGESHGDFNGGNGNLPLKDNSSATTQYQVAGDSDGNFNGGNGNQPLKNNSNAGTQYS